MLSTASSLALSSPAGATGNTPPGSPTNLTATPDNSHAGLANLSWTVPTNPGTFNGAPDTIQGYLIYDYSGTSGTWQPNGECSGASTSSCLITGLTPGETWTFEVATLTVNDQQSTTYSNTATVTLLPASTISLQSSPGATYNTPVTVTATTNTPGSVEFKYNTGGDLPGCSSVATTTTPTAGPFTATCSWTPSAGGATYTIFAYLSPTYSLSYTPSENEIKVNVALGTSSVTLSGYSGALYGSSSVLTATSNTVGAVEFQVGGTDIPGCASVATSSSSPFTATCPWTPGSTGSASLEALFTSYNTNYGLSNTGPVTVNVGPGTASVTLSGYSGAVYGSSSVLTATSNTAGAVEFQVGGSDIPGCASVATSSSSPFTATCPWTPGSAGAASLEALFTPSNVNYGLSNTGPVALSVRRATQPALTLTSTLGPMTKPLPLTVSGGLGTGAVTYSATDGTATGCTVSATAPYTLSATSAGTCLVTATEAGNVDYYPVSSTPTAVTMLAPPPVHQATLVVTSTAGTVTSPLDLEVSGGTGSGAVTYSATDGTATGCTVSATAPYTLSATSAGTCLVTATKAADGQFVAISSTPTLVTFALGRQAPLTVTSAAGTVGGRLTLTSSGGSGTGAVTFAVKDGTATGCAIGGADHNTLTAVRAGTCLVTATKAADGRYAQATSSPRPVTLGLDITAAHTSRLSPSVDVTTLRVQGLAPGARVMVGAPGLQVRVVRNHGETLTLRLVITVRAHPGHFVLRVIDPNGTQAHAILTLRAVRRALTLTPSVTVVR